MTNNINISLKNVENHSITPPAFLFENIQKRIVDEDAAQDARVKSMFKDEDKVYTDTPSFDTIFKKINDSDAINQFKPLKQYEVKPSITFDTLLNIVKNALYTTTDTTKVISIFSFKKVMSVAAAILVLIAGYISFKKVYPKNDIALSATNITSLQNATANKSLSVTDSIMPGKIEKEAIINIEKQTNKKTNQHYSEAAFHNKNKTEAVSKNIMAFAAPTIKIGDSTFIVIDNDYITTFASFSESILPVFLQAENPVATSIYIDKYSNINISENMAAMMKKMYKLKKNGNPTRRARKTKEKLEKWKVADNNYFDSTLNNPLNIIDLGEFILQK